MGIKIDKIEFENYRQYGTGILSFKAKGSNNLSVLIAKNGTGKTTLLNAITWCLYEKEYQLTDEKSALPVVNSASVMSADVGVFIPVSVAVTIVDENQVVEFRRSQSFKVLTNSSDIPDTIEGSSMLTASITSIEDFENTEIRKGVDAEVLVKQYFDETIFDFYFFDGEKLRDFFAAGRASTIKKSIFNISQVTLLETACSHTQKLLYERARKLGKDSPDIKNLMAEREGLLEQVSLAKKTRDMSITALKGYQDEHSKLDDLLRGYEPIKKLQTERLQREEELRKIEDETKTLHNDRTDFIRKYIVLLSLYPRIERTLQIINEKESHGDLPPSIDKNQVKMLLAHLDEPCPLCNGVIGETGRQHLQSLLDKISVTSQTSNYLKEIKSSLELFSDEAQKYRTVRGTLTQRSMDIGERTKDVKTRLQEINSTLSNYASDDGQVDVAKIERNRAELNEQIGVLNQQIGAAKATISSGETEIVKLDTAISAAAKKIQEHEDIQHQIQVLKMLYQNFNQIKSKIMDAMRHEIEITTWKIFDSMIWKKNTFGKITIDDSYDVSVFNKDGVKMTGSLSATEQMALAYAFTLAIHDASGKNCPLVIDSPLGRVSDENRENMARVLLEISGKKQIIMLFTPDEYSDSVKEMYKSKADVRILNLSEDEKFVEGIDH